ncbi:MAG: DNA mismatch repair endonuclease MutL [Bacteroidetes bacterium]|nr:DNA mismatch repair endonuclease MutL [Bacteroidota bacterium]
MADIIQLLPDAIANQIAAGEVIQRPASVVKELLENAVDAGATEIKLIIKEAGKSLIQVIDNGCGMSETDARMSFERHATSKIRGAEDLFAIKTMGFRGEAMASIAAVAQVEMRTRPHDQELGNRLVIEASEVKTQEACQCVAGTSLAVKNLFYNVPARRNFLKSNAAEMRHVVEEFQRIALANPELFFSLHHNNNQIFHLSPGNLRQRVVAVFGQGTNKKLVPVEEDTDVLKLHGFVGKPEFSKKTRGEQYFFVNDRFIKSGYLNHAVMTAYEDLLPKDQYPLYIIFIDIDPGRIDINVHPTKQEIKFDDERLVYNYLKVSIRHALGQFSITPSMDFDQETAFSKPNIPHSFNPETPRTETRPSGASAGLGNSGSSWRSGDSFDKPRTQDWQKLYEGLDQFTPSEDEQMQQEPLTLQSKATSEDKDDSGFNNQQRAPYQLHATYIISPIKSGFLLIDQQAAHERILYEKYLRMMENRSSLTQKALFPHTLQLSTLDTELLREILEQINHLGFDIQEFGGNTFVVHGVPADAAGQSDEQNMVETLLSQYKSNLDLRLDVGENLARSMARSAATKRGQGLSVSEMESLIDQLFACDVPYKSPAGRHCFITIELDELDKRFGG